MPNDWMEDLLSMTPEEEEQNRIHQEKIRLETQRKIKRAVQSENITFMESVGSKRKHEKGDIRLRNSLFIRTTEGIYDEPDTLGKIEFTLHENVRLQDIYIRANVVGRKIEGEMDRLLHIDIVAIFERYRGFGLSEKLLDRLFDIISEQYSGIPLSIEFINPIAEYTMLKVLKKKGMKHVFDEGLIHRYYDDSDKTIISTLQKKDPSICFC